MSRSTTANYWCVVKEPLRRFYEYDRLAFIHHSRTDDDSICWHRVRCTPHTVMRLHSFRPNRIYNKHYIQTLVYFKTFYLPKCLDRQNRRVRMVCAIICIFSKFTKPSRLVLLPSCAKVISFNSSGMNGITGGCNLPTKLLRMFNIGCEFGYVSVCVHLCWYLCSHGTFRRINNRQSDSDRERERDGGEEDK